VSSHSLPEVLLQVSGDFGDRQHVSVALELLSDRCVRAGKNISSADCRTLTARLRVSVRLCAHRSGRRAEEASGATRDRLRILYAELHSAENAAQRQRDVEPRRRLDARTGLGPTEAIISDNAKCYTSTSSRRPSQSSAPATIRIPWPDPVGSVRLL
jgi:hypothetical protein